MHVTVRPNIGFWGKPILAAIALLAVGLPASSRGTTAMNSSRKKSVRSWRGSVFGVMEIRKPGENCDRYSSGSP